MAAFTKYNPNKTPKKKIESQQDMFDNRHTRS